MLLEHPGRHMQEHGGSPQAEAFLAKSRELDQQASRFQKIAVGCEGLSPGNARQQHPAEVSEDSKIND
jgi:hypothetical protein